MKTSMASGMPARSNRISEAQINASSSNSNSNQLPLAPPNLSPDFQFFEMVHQDDFFSVIVNPQSVRTAHYEFLSQIRLMDNQNRFDTLTVSEKLVADHKHFFELMTIVTGERAFQEVLYFSNRSGKAQIDSPQWLKRIESAYLTVWIASMIEENLWAHYNYALNINIEKNVRKNDITNFFETRSETLQSQEVLAKHWHDIGNKGRQRLIEKLRQKAKEVQIIQQDSNYLFGAEQYFSFEQAYGGEIGSSSSYGQDDNSRFYASQLGLQRGYLNYNGMPSEEMAQVFASQAAASGMANSAQVLPFASAGGPQSLRPYQLYHFSDSSLRPQQARLYHESASRDQAESSTAADINTSKSPTPTKSSKDPVVADPDLKQITSYILQKEAVVSSMDAIKFLSETPLDELHHFALPDKTRKNILCRELLGFIQDDLRNHIQNQLIQEDPTTTNLVQNQGNDFLSSSLKGVSDQTNQGNSNSQADNNNNSQQQTNGVGGDKKRRKKRKKGGQAQEQPAIVIPQLQPGQQQDQQPSERKSLDDPLIILESSNLSREDSKAQAQEDTSLPEQYLQKAKLSPTASTTTKDEPSAPPSRESSNYKNSSSAQKQPNSMRVNRKTQLLDSGSKSQKVKTGQFESLKDINSSKVKQALNTDDVDRSSSEVDSKIGVTASSQQAAKTNKNKRQPGANHIIGQTTQETNTTTGEDTSESLSTHKQNDSEGVAKIFQLTASQSVDLIKPSKQMGDDSEIDQKAFSTKSKQNSSASQPQVTMHDKLAHPGNQHLLGAKKENSSRKDSNQRRKKSNTSSKSRGKNSQQTSQKSQAEQQDAEMMIELQAFVHQLINKACDMAYAEAQRPLSKQPKQTHQQSQASKNLDSRSASSPSGIQAEDLGTILTKQKSKGLTNQLKTQQLQVGSKNQSSIPAAFLVKQGKGDKKKQQESISPRDSRQLAKKQQASENAQDFLQKASVTQSFKEQSSSKLDQQSHQSKRNADDLTLKNQRSSDSIQTEETHVHLNQAATTSDSQIQNVKSSRIDNDKLKQADDQISAAHSESGDLTSKAQDKESVNAESTAEAEGEAGQRKKTKRNRNRKKNDKLDAMNNFLLKMHGDAPSSAAPSQTTKATNGGKQGTKARNEDKNAQQNSSQAQTKTAQRDSVVSEKRNNQKSQKTQNNAKQTDEQAKLKATQIATGAQSFKGKTPRQALKDDQPQLTEMQKYQTFTINDTAQQDFVFIPSLLPQEIQANKSLSSSVQDHTLKSSTSPFIPTKINLSQDTSSFQSANSKSSPQSDAANTKTSKDGKSVKNTNKIGNADQVTSKDQMPQQTTNKSKNLAKQESADSNQPGEKKVTLKISESLQGKKIMNKEQMESAKADFRARFIELERQKNVEAKIKSEGIQSLNGEQIQLGQKLNSEETKVSTSLLIECLDSSSKKQSESEEESKSNGQNGPLDSLVQQQSDQKETGLLQGDLDSVDINKNGMRKDSTSCISASDVSQTMSESQNPFMSVKASSFMPTAFVPSPNKAASIMSFNQSPITPMKVQNFTQASQQQFSGMPYKSVSMREMPSTTSKDKQITSARSHDSTENQSESADGKKSPISVNPFKQSSHYNLVKHKSVLVDNQHFEEQSSYPAQNKSQSSQDSHGFAFPDSASPFTFQPHKKSVPFGSQTKASQYPANQGASSLVGDDDDRASSSQDKSQAYAKQALDGDQATFNQSKKKHGPFKQSKGQQFSQIHVETNFGGSDCDGKNNYNKSKSHYQAIQKGTNERYSYNEETKQGYRGKNNRNLEFEQNKTANNQHSPLQNPAYFKRHNSNEKLGSKKGITSQQEPSQKGHKSNRALKSQRKMSPERPYYVNSEDDFFDATAGGPTKQDNSNGSQHSGRNQSNANIALNQVQSFTGSEMTWQTTPRGASFTPSNQHPYYQSPMQQMPLMQFNNYENTHGQTVQGQQLSYPTEDDYTCLIGPNGAQQLPVYDEYTPANPVEGGNLLMQAADVSQYPLEEEIVAAAGICASNINFENLLKVESNVKIDEEAKKLMEADPVYKMLEDKFYKVFDQHIIDYTSKIGTKIDSFKDEREFVKNKIESIARNVLNCERICIKVFGSLVTGLALESSDMDMAVTGLDICDRTTLIEDLHTLSDALDKWDLVKELKSIETASIPVIKAKIDLKKIRLIIKEQAEEKKSEDSNDSIQNEDGKEDQQKEPQLPIEIEDDGEPNWLPIDITFDDSQQDASAAGPVTFEPNMLTSDPFGMGLNTILGGLGAFGAQKDTYGLPMAVAKTHLGMASCNLLKEYTSTYPCLREVGMILKEFLTIHDLNTAYLGGISSYSAILLIVAYMNNFNLQQSPHITPSRLLMGFLDFYSNCFDPRLYGVNTLSEMSFYAQAPQSQSIFIIVDPVNPQNNTARNSHRTPEILKKFQETFLHLKNLIQAEYLRLKSLRQQQQSQVDVQSINVQTTDACEDDKTGQISDQEQNKSSGSGLNELESEVKSDSDNLASEVCAQTNAQEQQQKLPNDVKAASTHQPEAEAQTCSQPSTSSPFTSMKAASSSSPSFTPKKDFQVDPMFLLRSRIAGRPPLAELLVQPFFFVSVDLIEHLFGWREELQSVALVAGSSVVDGESRPSEDPSKSEQQKRPARSSSNAASK